MAGNHYSRSVATLEMILQNKLAELELLEEENMVLKRKEHALTAACSGLAGGLDATKSMLGGSCTNSANTQPHTPSASNNTQVGESPPYSTEESFGVEACSTPSNSSQLTDSSGLLQRIAQRELEVQSTLQNLGCADGCPQLYTTKLMQRATSSPSRVAAHLVLSVSERLAITKEVVQKIGVLLPKYDSALMVTSAGSSKQMLDKLVDELSERVLTCRLLDPPMQQLCATMYNMETGEYEPYPEGWWPAVAESLQLTTEQKDMLKVYWSRVKARKIALIEQHQQSAKRLAELQSQQHEKQQQFEQQASSVYEAATRFCQLQLVAQQERLPVPAAQQQQVWQMGQQPQVRQQLQQQLLPMQQQARPLQQWEQELEAQLLREIDIACQQQQQVAADACLNEEDSYPPISTADIAAAAAAMLAADVYQDPVAAGAAKGAANGAANGAVQPQWQQQVQVVPPMQKQPVSSMQHMQQALLQQQGWAPKVQASTGAVFYTSDEGPPPLQQQWQQSVQPASGSFSNYTHPQQQQQQFTEPTSGSFTRLQLPSQQQQHFTQPANGSNSKYTPPQQQQQQTCWTPAPPLSPLQQVQTSSNSVEQHISIPPEICLKQEGQAVLPSAVDPANINQMLIRHGTSVARDLLVQVHNREQPAVELLLDKLIGQLKMLDYCMTVHLHNIMTQKQLAQYYLSCYPYVPEALSLFEAFDDMGW